MGTPIYVGKARRGKFKDSVSIGFNRDHLQILLANMSETGWVNLIVSPQKNNPDKYSVKIDDWQPRSAYKAEERVEQERQGWQPNDSLSQRERLNIDDLPF